MFGKLGGVSFDTAVVAGNRYVEPDARTQVDAQHVRNLSDSFLDVEHLRLQGLAAREGKELAGKLGRLI